MHRRVRLLPPPLAFFIDRSTKRECVELLGDTVLLLVRVGAPSSELARGLMSSSSVESDRLFPTVEAEGTGTRTRMMAADEYGPPSGGHVLTAAKLAGLLDEAVHFVAPCRRRRLPDRPVQQLVSIGRGDYNDLVLRDSTVSSYHAWLECDEEGAFYLADARSRNATRVNDRRLDGRLTKLYEGDVIRFGSVEAVVCHPSTLWDALR